MTIGTGVKDRAGNPLATASTVSFTTGSTGGTNTTPPFVISSNPTNGSQSFRQAPRLMCSSPKIWPSPAAAPFNIGANIGLFLDNFGVPGTAVTATNTYNSTTRTVTITPTVPLTASTGYILKVANTTTSSTGATVGEFRVSFKTAAGADTTKPRVLGVYPSDASVGIVRNLNNIALGFLGRHGPGFYNFVVSNTFGRYYRHGQLQSVIQNGRTFAVCAACGKHGLYCNSNDRLPQTLSGIIFVDQIAGVETIISLLPLPPLPPPMPRPRLFPPPPTISAWQSHFSRGHEIGRRSERRR